MSDHRPYDKSAFIREYGAALKEYSPLNWFSGDDLPELPQAPGSVAPADLAKRRRQEAIERAEKFQREWAWKGIKETPGRIPGMIGDGIASAGRGIRNFIWGAPNPELADVQPPFERKPYQPRVPLEKPTEQIIGDAPVQADFSQWTARPNFRDMGPAELGNFIRRNPAQRDAAINAVRTHSKGEISKLKKQWNEQRARMQFIDRQQGKPDIEQFRLKVGSELITRYQQKQAEGMLKTAAANYQDPYAGGMRKLAASPSLSPSWSRSIKNWLGGGGGGEASPAPAAAAPTVPNRRGSNPAYRNNNRSRGLTNQITPGGPVPPPARPPAQTGPKTPMTVGGPPPAAASAPAPAPKTPMTAGGPAPAPAAPNPSPPESIDTGVYQMPPRVAERLRDYNSQAIDAVNRKSNPAARPSGMTTLRHEYGGTPSVPQKLPGRGLRDQLNPDGTVRMPEISRSNPNLQLLDAQKPQGGATPQPASPSQPASPPAAAEQTMPVLPTADNFASLPQNFRDRYQANFDAGRTQMTPEQAFQYYQKNYANTARTLPGPASRAGSQGAPVSVRPPAGAAQVDYPAMTPQPAAQAPQPTQPQAAPSPAARQAISSARSALMGLGGGATPQAPAQSAAAAPQASAPDQTATPYMSNEQHKAEVAKSLADMQAAQQEQAAKAQAQREANAGNAVSRGYATNAQAGNIAAGRGGYWNNQAAAWANKEKQIQEESAKEVDDMIAKNRQYGRSVRQPRSDNLSFGNAGAEANFAARDARQAAREQAWLERFRAGPKAHPLNGKTPAEIAQARVEAGDLRPEQAAARAANIQEERDLANAEREARLARGRARRRARYGY